MRAEDAAGNIAGIHQAWHGCLTAIAGIAPDSQPHPAATGLYRELTSRNMRRAQPWQHAKYPSAP